MRSKKIEKNKDISHCRFSAKESYNRQLALTAKVVVGDRADFELLEYQDIPLMNQDIEYPAPKAVKSVRDAVKSADGIWFFTPEYNHYFPGVLKNLIDWLSRPINENEPQVLAGKPAAISGISPAMAGTRSGTGPSCYTHQFFKHGCYECTTAYHTNRNATA